MKGRQGPRLTLVSSKASGLGNLTSVTDLATDWETSQLQLEAINICLSTTFSEVVHISLLVKFCISTLTQSCISILAQFSISVLHQTKRLTFELHFLEPAYTPYNLSLYGRAKGR